MTRRHTHEQAVEKLHYLNPDISFYDTYVHSHYKVRFICKNQHIWLSKPNDIFNNHGCPICYGNKKYTVEEFSQLLANKDTGFKLVGDYFGMNKKTSFVCANNHVSLKTPNDVMNGKKCQKCYEQTFWSKEKINDILQNTGRKIQLVGKYNNYITKTKFQCDLGHVWEASVSNILRKKNPTGCPSCAGYGFDINKPAFGYVILFEDFIKYGITNDLDNRLLSHSRSGSFELISKIEFGIGKDALLWEKKIKKLFGGNHVDRNRIKNGFTETLPNYLLDGIMKATET